MVFSMSIRMTDLLSSLWHFLHVSMIVFGSTLLTSGGCVLGQTAKDGEVYWNVHSLSSPFQAQDTSLRVLLPDAMHPDRRYPCLFVLPVHEDGIFRHGDGLEEVRRLNIHNEHQVICVAPSFTAQPWYVDHDRDPTRKDESHLLNTVLPFLASHYPVRTDREGRFLVGFSKSGRGAMSLLLRHSELFYKAVAWDPGIRIDMGPHDDGYDLESQISKLFGTRANFERYRIPHLIRTLGPGLVKEARLFYFSCDGVVRTSGGVKIHSLLVEEGIPHRYVMEPKQTHRWDSGWLPEAMKFLFGESTPSKD